MSDGDEDRGGVSEALFASASTEDVEGVVFGPDCRWCEQERPCGCGREPCRCTCGRCLWPYPLSDDGPVRE